MTSDEFFMIEKAKYNEEIKQLEEQIKKMTNLVQHLRNKFLNILDCVDQKGSHMIQHVVEYIDENIESIDIEKNEIETKFTKKLIDKMSKE